MWTSTGKILFGHLLLPVIDNLAKPAILTLFEHMIAYVEAPVREGRSGLSYVCFFAFAAWYVRSHSIPKGRSPLNKRLITLVMAVLLVLSLPLQASAASTARLSKTAQASIEKLAAQSSASLQSQLTGQMNRLQELETQNERLDQSIDTLHRANAEKQSAINTRIKQLNADKLASLKSGSAEARERYKPIFTLQTSLNKQLTVARKLKNKPLVEALEAQLSVVKASALIARGDIRLKDEAYAKVKTATAKTANSVRNVLKEVSQEQAKIRSEKTASAETGRQIAADSKTLTASLKNKDAGESLRSLSALTTSSAQIISQKSRIKNSEEKISTLLGKAASLLP